MSSTPAIRSLSFHAQYACRQSGACCTSNWPIPIEADRLAVVQAALATGHLRLADDVSTAIPLTHVCHKPGVIIGRHDDACVFFDRQNGRLCRIHGALGHDALPLACRQFPRVSVIDPRGVSVTLSHYCPTAARALDEDGPVSIVDRPAAFPADGEYVGLDAQESLPPLLRPDMLMDWDAWWEWERLAVACLSVPARTPAASLDVVASAVEQARGWRPGNGALIERVRGAFDISAKAPRDIGAETPRVDRPSRAELVAGALEAIPEEHRTGAVPPNVETSDRVARRYLAAHAFANWTTHLGDGLRSWLRSLDTALALVDAGLGVRHADLVLRHLADPYAFAKTCSVAERQA